MTKKNKATVRAAALSNDVAGVSTIPLGWLIQFMPPWTRSALLPVFVALLALAMFPGMPLRSDNSQEGVQALMDWIQELGGKDFDNVEVRMVNKDGYKVKSLLVTRDIDVTTSMIGSMVVGVPLFGIPASVVLHADHPTVLGSPFGKEVDKHHRLTVFLAVERLKTLSGEASHWAPYISVMPTPQDLADFHPLFAPRPLLDTFAALPAAQDILSTVAAWQSVWKQNQERWTSLARSIGVKSFTLHDFFWAIAVIHSRSSSFSWASPSLVPAFDLINCGQGANMKLDATERSAPVHAVAMRSLRRGDELLQYCMGNAANDVLFVRFGVVFTHNPYRINQLNASACSSLPKESVSNGDAVAMVSGFEALAREACQRL